MRLDMPAGGNVDTTFRYMDSGFWKGRSVLVTGHTGFKGAWLSLWLQSLGACVTGLSLGVPSDPSLYELARIHEGMTDSIDADIRDQAAVVRAIERSRPEVVIHLAAQPLVRRSFALPRETYETNVMGTVNVLDAVRIHAGYVRALVIVTSDKCYENHESQGPYTEDDPLGGHDPYSSSKAAAELVTSAYRRSFFSTSNAPRVASARAGNVIGGGDFGEDRLIPDIVRAVTAGETLRLRNPAAIRPWQHVLSPLSGYLVLAQALHESHAYAGAWNFGPHKQDTRTVEWIVRRVSELLPGGVSWESDSSPQPPETQRLELDSTVAHELLGWKPLITLDDALPATVAWFRSWADGQDVREVTREQLTRFGRL